MQHRIIGIAVIAGVFTACGWFLGSAKPLWHPLPATETSSAPAPLAVDRVRVFGDGTVSIQLRRAPLRWLLDELTRQGGALPAEATAPQARRGAMTPVAIPNGGPSDGPEDSEKLASTDVLRRLREGTETERLAALQEANSTGAHLPAELLQQFIDLDASDQVRVEALKAYVDGHANDADAVARVLEAGRYNSSAAVRGESNSRLEIFDQRLHVQSDNPQPSESDPEMSQ